MKYYALTLLILFMSCGQKNTEDSLEVSKGSMVAESSTLWNKGRRGELVELKILFLDGTEQEQEEVSKVASTWTKYANIKMSFYKVGEISLPKADIKISFNAVGNQSYIGIGSRSQKNTHSMSLSNLSKSLKSLRRATILHEFGHALGLAHEHQSPKRTISFDRERLLAYCKDTLGWSEDSCLNNYKKLDEKGYIIYDYDHKSVMHYSLHGSIFGKEDLWTPVNTFLSLEDKLSIADLYPGLESVDEQSIRDEEDQILKWVEDTDQVGNCYVTKLTRKEFLNANDDEKKSFTHYQYGARNTREYAVRFLMSKRDALYNMENDDFCVLSKQAVQQKVETQKLEQIKSRSVGNCMIVPSEETLVRCPVEAFLVTSKDNHNHLLSQTCYSDFQEARDDAAQIDFCNYSTEELARFYLKREELSFLGPCEVKKSTVLYCNEKTPYGIIKGIFPLKGSNCFPHWEGAYEQMVSSSICNQK